MTLLTTLYPWPTGVAAVDDPYGYTVPDLNDPNLTYGWQTERTAADEATLRHAFLLDGVIQGCRVTARTPVAWRLDVASGTVFIEGASYPFDAVSFDPPLASTLYARRDLLVVEVASGRGHLRVVTGIAGDHPWPPSVPLHTTPLAELSLPARAVVIQQGQLTDKRLFLASAWPSQHNYSVLAGHASNTLIVANSTVYGGFIGRFVPSATETDFELVIPRAGTLSRFSVVNGADSSLCDVMAYVRKNETDTGLSVQVSNFAGTYTNSTDSVSVAAGDRIAVKFHEDSGLSDLGPIRGISVLYDAP